MLPFQEATVIQNRILLRLLAAAAAAEDRLSELLPNPEDDACILLLRAAMAETERSFPPSSYVERKLPLAQSPLAWRC